MNKVFLSHSSKDKPYVEYIANRFGKNHCVYDAVCFEAGMKTLDEIFREMDNSSIFVVFISESALESDWVQKELTIAEDRLRHDTYKLSQIFPIIIDPTIRHNDPRIPDFLKKGFDSYNLRVITSNKVAFRKIKAQQSRFLLENNLMKQPRCFYGRDAEIAKFKEVFDSGKPIKCLIASGFSGIGRNSYLLECLRRTQIVESYYLPPVVSVTAPDTIEDLILKLSQIGFANYALEDIVSLPDMDSKINVLSEVLTAVQNYSEQVLIYDENCLVDRRGDIVYWFEKALSKIRNEVTVIIAARTEVHPNCARRNPHIFTISLSTLTRNEWLGLMRVYAKHVGLELTSDDRNYFTEIITGYPPQVLFAVNLMNDTSVQEVKDNPYPIVERFSPKITKMLNALIPTNLKDDTYGFLAFISTYGVVPTDLVQLVTKIKDEYKQAFTLLKRYTVCRYLGLAHEYIEINPLVSDFIQRSRFALPNDIKQLLDARIKEIRSVVDSGESTLTEDFEELKFYLKQNIIQGKNIPERFMYSTLYMSSIYELYNNQKYTHVIALVEKLKESHSFERYDLPAKDRIQSYYCRSLARQTDKKFYEEVEYFNPRKVPNKQDEYNFLRGFMYRNESQYDKALEWFKKVLSRQPGHKSAMREIVTVYRGLEDYESAYEYARTNYLNDSDNLYHIQPYFEILIRKDIKDLSDEESGHIDEMLTAINGMLQTTPSATHYEILGLHAAFVDHDLDRAVAFLESGATKHPESSYIIKYLFDCYELFDNIQGMTTTLVRLESFGQTNKAAEIAYKIRQAVLYAYLCKPRSFINNYINAIPSLNADSKNRLIRKTGAIIHKQETLIPR